MRRILLLVVFGIGTAWPAMGQRVGTEDFDPLGEFLDTQANLRIQVEWIEVPEEKFTELMEPARNGANDGDLRDTARAMVKDGEATMLESLAISTRSGQRAKIESIQEYIYATEYEPPQTATNTGEGTLELTKEAALASIVPTTATAFDVRNVGATCEVDPVVGADGMTIDINLAPELVYLAGETEVEEWKTPAIETKISQPTFYTVRISTSVSVLRGQYHMIGAISPKGDDGVRDPSKKVMMFVRVDIVQVGR